MDCHLNRQAPLKHRSTFSKEKQSLTVYLGAFVELPVGVNDMDKVHLQWFPEDWNSCSEASSRTVSNCVLRESSSKWGF